MNRVVVLLLSAVGSVVVVVGLLVAVLILPYTLSSLTACTEEEKAVFEEFPHFGGIEREPEPFTESGGCAVFYDTRASQERVAEYYMEQLESRGWKAEQMVSEATLIESGRTAPSIWITAHRDDFFYEVGFESLELYDPPRPGAHVAVHLSKGE